MHAYVHVFIGLHNAYPGMIPSRVSRKENFAEGPASSTQ